MSRIALSAQLLAVAFALLAVPAARADSEPAVAAERHPTVDLNGVEATMIAHKQDFQSCYHQEVVDGDAPSGTVKMAFIVDPKGRVTRIGIRESNLGSPRLENCVQTATRKISFPARQGGGFYQVTYPLSFQSG